MTSSTNPTIPDEQLRRQAALLMAMVDSGKAHIEPTDPDDGIGVAWIRVMDAAAIAAAAFSGTDRNRSRGPRLGSAAASNNETSWPHLVEIAGLKSEIARKGGWS